MRQWPQGGASAKIVSANARPRGNAFARFFYDPRNFEREISPSYWATRRPANGRSLHHWLFPKRYTWVPEGIRNAGFNLVEMPPLRGVVDRSLDANTWMGFAGRWGGRHAARAAQVEKAIRVGLPATAGGAAYSGYQAGRWIENVLTESK